MNDVIRKIFSLLFSLLFVATLTFFLIKVIPGDPFDDEQSLPKEIHQALRQHYGLDQPWYIQYQHYLYSLLQGDLGPSFKYKGQTVNAIISQSFPVSALLGLSALFLAITGGIILGTFAALKANQWQESLILLATTGCLSIPSFILATLLQYFLAMKWSLFPLARWGSLSHLILPSIALAALPMAFIARLIRSTMIEVLHSDFIRTAKAKGLPARLIITRHALRHALLPVITYLGPLTANILVGSFIIEKIFSIPGLGQWFVNSVSNRDYTVIMGLTLFYSVILMTSVSFIDLIYRFLDPRIAIGRK